MSEDEPAVVLTRWEIPSKYPTKTRGKITGNLTLNTEDGQLVLDFTALEFTIYDDDSSRWRLSRLQLTAARDLMTEALERME